MKKIRNYFILVGLILFLIPIHAQNKNNVIFETDMGNDVDDVLALDMLYKYMERGKINLLAIMSNKRGVDSPDFIDIMNTWYGHKNIPIGRAVDGIICGNESNNYAKHICELKIGEKPVFKHSIKDVSKLPDAVLLYRKILSRQADHSVVIISTGFFTNLAKLINTPPDRYSYLNGRNLIAKKVRYFSVMGGSFSNKPIKEYNIAMDLKSSIRFFTECPVPIVVSPFEVGISIMYPGASIEHDFIWAKHHPMVEAYKSYMKMPYDRPTWDLTSVLYAAEPDSSFMTLSTKGNISIDSIGYTHFSPSTNGKDFYLSVSSAQAERIKQYFIRLITSKPQNKK